MGSKKKKPKDMRKLEKKIVNLKYSKKVLDILILKIKNLTFRFLEILMLFLDTLITTAPGNVYLKIKLIHVLEIMELVILV